MRTIGRKSLWLLHVPTRVKKKDKRETQAPAELEAWQEPGCTFHIHTLRRDTDGHSRVRLGPHMPMPTHAGQDGLPCRQEHRQRPGLGTHIPPSKGTRLLGDVANFQTSRGQGKQSREPQGDTVHPTKMGRTRRAQRPLRRSNQGPNLG